MKSPNVKSLQWQISVEETTKQQKAKRMNMSEKNVVVANFNAHTEVGTAVREFKRSDLPMKRLIHHWERLPHRGARLRPLRHRWPHEILG